ncbi:MAG: hypothetical protein PHO03_02150 [Candidatus Omnitrophica bacterium]|nr:hypothetical protein [Candidatus Omnitrophota bacterium]
MLRENKKGEHAQLRYLYSHSDTEKRRYLTGEDLYDFIISCKAALPDKATYNILGLDETREVTARYLLWPARRELQGPDFLIVYGNLQFTQSGYLMVKACKNTGALLAREGIKK